RGAGGGGAFGLLSSVGPGGCGSSGGRRRAAAGPGDGEGERDGDGGQRGPTEEGGGEVHVPVRPGRAECDAGEGGGPDRPAELLAGVDEPADQPGLAVA